MSLIVFNGSPRGKESNSTVITSWFTASYGTTSINYLNKIKQQDDFLEASKAYNQILFVFPLYVDGMPGQVKLFMEKMFARKEYLKDKDVCYIIHSGFSEAVHSKNLEGYLKRFSTMVGLNNKGIVILPGSEGFRLMPDQFTKKKAEKIGHLGKMFKDGLDLDNKLIMDLEGPSVSPLYKRLRFKLFSLFGLTNIYWNSQLKRNGAYKQRFDKPYT